MSEEQIQSGKIVIASAGMLLYGFSETGGMQILVGTRQNKPWKNCNMFVFGGLIESTDENALDAALRETRQETGGLLKIQPYPLPIGTYGPKSFHHSLTLDPQGNPKARRTEQPISDDFNFSMTVYMGCVMRGKARNTAEVSNFQFIDPIEFARNKKLCAFDQALILQHFCWFYKNWPSI